MSPRSHTVVSKKPPKPQPSGETTLRITLSTPGLDLPMVVAYVRDAIDGWNGQFEASDPRRDIRVVRLFRRAWVDVVEDGEAL